MSCWWGRSLLQFVRVQFGANQEMMHLSAIVVGGVGVFDVDNLFGGWRWSLVVWERHLRNVHDSSTARTHCQSSPSWQEQDGATANTRDANLVELRDGVAQRTANRGSTHWVGEQYRASHTVHLTLRSALLHCCFCFHLPKEAIIIIINNNNSGFGKN